MHNFEIEKTIEIAGKRRGLDGYFARLYASLLSIPDDGHKMHWLAIECDFWQRIVDTVAAWQAAGEEGPRPYAGGLEPDEVKVVWRHLEEVTVRIGHRILDRISGAGKPLAGHPFHA